MEKEKVKLWILHAGIEHPSPYFYNFCLNLNGNNDYDYIVNPDLPLDMIINKGIVYFNRLKRFYDSNNIETANCFLKDIDILKHNGWKIVWTIHNFFPIDRELTFIDEYVTDKFIKKCDLVFTVSEYMKKNIKCHYSVDAIVHGVGLNTIKSGTKINFIKGADKNSFTFTFVGNIYKYKMLDEIVASFNKLNNCRLIIAGCEPKNSGVNIEKLICGNNKITFLNYFIDENGWDVLSKMTDAFISIYDLEEPAFKYGFFPSNFINISKTGIKCISPRHDAIEEMMNETQMIYYDFGNENGLIDAMKKAMINVSKKPYKKVVSNKIKYNYNWSDVIKCFTDNCNKLFYIR